MKSKLIRFIVAGLLVVLAITSIFTYKSYERNKQAKIQSSINNQVKVEQQTYRVISSKQVIEQLKKENSTNVLSGQCKSSMTLTTKSISDDDISMRWINKWFKDANSQDVTISGEYKFVFAYDNSNPEVNCKDGVINIYLTPNKLQLMSVERISETSVDRIGDIVAVKNAIDSTLFVRSEESKTFNQQQRTALSLRVQEEAKNTILSDKNNREKAMENTKDAISTNLKAVFGDDIKINFICPTYDVVQQDVATIVDK